MKQGAKCNYQTKHVNVRKKKIFITDYPTCWGKKWRCKNGQCIDEDSRCDLYYDCFDKSDETNCEGEN